MLLRRLVCTLLALSLVTIALAKEKVTLKSLLAKSDAVYYTPLTHGLTDLAVDISIEQLEKNNGKDVLVTYYYAGDNRQHMEVTNAPDDTFRAQLLDLLMPLSQYVIPHAASANLSNMSLKLLAVSRQIPGIADTTFYQIIGTVPDSKSDLKEYRVLLDKNGLVHRLENEMTKGGTIAASVDNVQMKDGTWLFSALSTRMAAKEGDIWKTERLEYDTVDGFFMPVRCVVEYRDIYNKPVKGRVDLSIRLTNYRINKGVADAAMTELEKKNPPAPATPPAQ